ncbi:hypothetical protein [Hwanghaeella sp.]|uniref:hypothetical protein n=1 Tax=Hwanghaeella sp. TaxID=2605943 RepID=UPI003CCBB03D
MSKKPVSRTLYQGMGPAALPSSHASSTKEENEDKTMNAIRKHSDLDVETPFIKAVRRYSEAYCAALDAPPVYDDETSPWNDVVQQASEIHAMPIRTVDELAAFLEIAKVEAMSDFTYDTGVARFSDIEIDKCDMSERCLVKIIRSIEDVFGVASGGLRLGLLKKDEMYRKANVEATNERSARLQRLADTLDPVMKRALDLVSKTEGVGSDREFERDFELRAATAVVSEINDVTGEASRRAAVCAAISELWGALPKLENIGLIEPALDSSYRITWDGREVLQKL